MFPPNDPNAQQTAPAEQPPTNPMVTVPLSDEDRARWTGEIKRADDRRKIFEKAWEKNLRAYSPDPTNEKWGDEVNPGVDFYTVEQKKDQLFFDTPEVILTIEPDADPSTAPQIMQRQASLNRKLGRKDLDMKRLMDKILVDILCPSGEGWVKIGVTRITKDVPQPTNPSQTSPVPIYQKIFCERFSPKKGLKPTNFHDTEFKKAPWKGMKFTIPTRQAIREFGLPPDFKGNSKTAQEQVFTQAGVRPDEGDEDQTTGTEIWYRTSLYDDAIWHPDHQRQLVFVDGQDDPVVHRDSPYQTFDPQSGTFTPDSMVDDFPIRVGTIRDMPDSSFVSSDCSQHRPLVNELARFRTQMVEHRDASTSIRYANERVITPEQMAKIVRGPWGAILAIPENDYNPNQPPIAELAHPQYGRENYQAQDIIERDIAKISSLSANQAAGEEDTTRSATELTYIERAKDVRLQAERNRVAGFYLSLVTGIDVLMKRYETQPGQQPISGYSYDIKPDSGMHVDAAADRKFGLDIWNMFAKEPNINTSELLKEVLPLCRLDPTKLITQPPPPGPKEPSTSMIVKGEDLNPLAPQYQNTSEVLTQLGFKLTAVQPTPQLIQNAALSKPIKQPVHGGTPEEPDLVSKHQADESGQTANFGGQAGSVQ